MGQTLLDITNQALSNDFDPSNYQAVTEQAVRDALSDIARRIDMPGLRATFNATTVAGTATLTLPSDDVRIYSAFNPVFRDQLDEVAQEAVDTAVAASGRPYLYAVSGSTVTLYPTPDDAYSLQFRYAKDVTGIVEATDLSTFVPDTYLNMLVAFARHRLFRLEDDVAMSQFWRAEYERDLGRMEIDVQRGDRNRVRQVPGPYRLRRALPRFGRP